MFASIEFYFGFLVYDYYYIIADYILLYRLCSILPVSCPYLIIPWVFPAWCRLLSLYLLLYVCAHDMVFNACLWCELIDTRVFIYAHHLAFVLPLFGKFWLSWILSSGLRAWSLWILAVADQSGAAEAWIPSRPSRSPILPGPPARL